MGHITQQTHNVVRFSDFDLVTSEDVEAAESLMPEFYGVLFHNCYEITSSAFYANNRVEILYMNKSGIISIGSFAFNKCKNLKIAYLPSDLRYIYNSLFEGCEKLKEIVLPEGLISIGDEAFKGCSSLEEITIPESVVSIGYNVFKGCENLRKIGVPRKLVETLGENIILGQYCKAELVVYDEGETIELSSVDRKKSSSVIENGIIVPNTEILTADDVSKPISSKPKIETRSFNGVIRRNLMVEKKKK